MLMNRQVVTLFLSLWVGSPALAATIHVPKDHRTIQAAIDATAPGDTVLVEPGTYRENVRLKERVTVKSAGDDTKGNLGLKRAEAVILDGGGVEAKGPAGVLAEGAVLDGFTISRVGVFDQKEYDKHYATQGENLPDERGAVGAGTNFPALAVPAVTAVVKNNIVCANGHAGIGCLGGTGKRNASLISKNVVYKNMGGGIGISDGATPTVEGNRCYNNLRAGIGNRNSSALIIGNECFDNVRAGIGVREGAKPVIRGNKCYKNRRAGIGCRMEGTSPVIEDNDLHAPALESAFRMPVLLLKGEDVFLPRIRSWNLENLVMVGPDAGGLKRAQRYARALGVRVVAIAKDRPRPDQAEPLQVLGEVRDCACLIVDDMAGTGRTLAGAAEVLKKAGAREIHAVFTHAVMAPGALDRLLAAPLGHIVTSDSVPGVPHPSLEVVRIAPVLARACRTLLGAG